MIDPDRSSNLSAEGIRLRVMQEYLGAPILDNNLRGYWCEAMVAQALGPECRITSQGWAPWDLEIGNSNDTFPHRIRIQVKNAARRQTWHQSTSAGSEAVFTLSYRKRPLYWTRDFPDHPCEDAGFLCDIFALCYHEEIDPISADQRDPSQWKVFLVSAYGADGDITKAELASCSTKLEIGQQRASLNRRPDTMVQGIRGRRPAKPIHLPDLKLHNLYDTLAQSRNSAS